VKSSQDIEVYLERHRTKELLRFLTCGSVDDGKSTLIGRLLHDTKTIYEDQLASIKKATVRHGTTGEEIDFALLTDGLEAEREQGITIDVAYRYFSTDKRKFIIADTPGHEQYTRNMATGASNCDLAVILIDAGQGVMPQTRRHAFIATQLGIKHLIVAVNKMDKHGYSEGLFETIRADFTAFAARLQVPDIRFLPISALKGDNIVKRSTRMTWFQGAPLLDQLETVTITGDRNLIDLRFPIQSVLRPNSEFRGFSGTIASGVLREGDEIAALPSGHTSKVASILAPSGRVEEAFAPMAVTVTLADEIDISRGDMLVKPNNRPRVATVLEAMLVWMNEQPLQCGRSYLLKHTTQVVPAQVNAVRYHMNVNTLRKEDAQQLALNEIGRVTIETGRAIAYDPYVKNRATGGFILIDRMTNATVCAGMILDRGVSGQDAEREMTVPVIPPKSVQSQIEPAARAERLNQKALTVWLTGLPCSGKSSLTFGLEKRLWDEGYAVTAFDSAKLRRGISRNLGFSPFDRTENARLAAEIASLNIEQGLITLVGLVSPNAADREAAREMIGADRFVEVYCQADADVCAARDPDGLYERARKGEITNFTGVDAAYDAPKNPQIVIDTVANDAEACVTELFDALKRLGYLDRGGYE
jgi:bifunctional enzyme CysN/CysC